MEEINVDGLTWEDVCLKIPVVKKPKCMDQVCKYKYRFFLTCMEIVKVYIKHLTE